MLEIESAAGPEVQETRTLLRSKTWDLRNKASDEKTAASRHFPLMLLRSMRLVHTTDAQVKQMSRRYLAWVRNLYSYLGKNKMTKDDGNDMAKTSTCYKGVADRLSMVQSGVYKRGTAVGSGGFPLWRFSMAFAKGQAGMWVLPHN